MESLELSRVCQSRLRFGVGTRFVGFGHGLDIRLVLSWYRCEVVFW